MAVKDEFSKWRQCGSERIFSKPEDRHQPHFLGAVVLQQMPNQSGLMQQRTIIDGQQRLTTLQLLLDALAAELAAVNAGSSAARIEPLVVNAEPFCTRPEDRFKVWPTNRDRPAFNEVMGAKPPVNHVALVYRREKMAQAHQYFSEQAPEWLREKGADNEQARATAIERTARELLQIVVIDLAADENAQEIFETLAGRAWRPTHGRRPDQEFHFPALAGIRRRCRRGIPEILERFRNGVLGNRNQRRSPSLSATVFLNHWLAAQTAEEVVAVRALTDSSGLPTMNPGFRCSNCCGDSMPRSWPLPQIARRCTQDRRDMVGQLCRAVSVSRLHKNRRITCWLFRSTIAMSVLQLPAQPVDATQALNLSAGVSNCKVSRGRSFS